MWCIPSLTNEYVERMEDLLRLYSRPLDAAEPVVCFDEKSVQCLADKARAVRVKNGSVRRDYEYVRKGTANVFCAVEPLAGRHMLKVTKQRKNRDFAYMLRDIARTYPQAARIHLVLDNLRNHRRKALVDTFGEQAGDELWSRFTVHYTPKHASWLNQAEIQIGLLSRQCLGKRRLESIEQLRREVGAWRRRANRQRLRIQWTFSVRRARRKFGYTRRRGKINLSRN